MTRNTHVKYQSSSTHCSKVISKVKVSERRTELQNDRMTERTKTICPPIFDLGGIKKKKLKGIYLESMMGVARL